MVGYMRALSIRQPWAELILRGVKTVEYRSRPTHIIGERFWIYASSGPFNKLRACGIAKTGTSRQRAAETELSPAELRGVTSDNLAVDGPPGWMWELAEALILSGDPLPRGVIVGSAVIETVTPGDAGGFQWHLAGVERAPDLRKPRRHPQPAWFRPF